MLSTVILFITATLGFVCLASIYIQRKRGERSLINKYLKVIIAFQALRFMIYGLMHGQESPAVGYITLILDVCIVALMPCFFLYFRDIVQDQSFEPGTLLHFVAPSLFVLIYIARQFVLPDTGVFFREAFVLAGILFYSLYAYYGFRLLNKHVWRRKSDINTIQRQNELIRDWTIMLYACFIAIVIIRMSTGFLLQKDFQYNTQFLWITALIWSGIFIKILLTPEILYGYDFLNQTISKVTEKLALQTVWKINGMVTTIMSEKDKKIADRISSSLIEHIHSIEELSFRKHAFRDPNMGMDELAAVIKIPSSHVYHIFKFHCNESFTDYKKIVRIHDATKLLENGYLQEKTIESLSETVGFSSYATFYVAFKSIMGMSTHEYAKKFQADVKSSTKQGK